MKSVVKIILAGGVAIQTPLIADSVTECYEEEGDYIYLPNKEECKMFFPKTVLVLVVKEEVGEILTPNPQAVVPGNNTRFPQMR